MGWFQSLFRGSRKPAESAIPPIAELPTQPAIAWTVIGTTVRGASHERSGLPNQDSIGWWPQDVSEVPLVLAVADGHGSAKSFRSHEGARLAVQEAISCFRELLGQVEPQDFASLVKRSLEELLPREIERRWKTAVARHLDEHPLLVDEVKAVAASQGQAARQAVEDRPWLAYGTTVLAVAVHQSFLACLQLGDGDILIVDGNGTVARPVPHDSRLIANETTSLGGMDAWKDVRSAFHWFGENPPPLILVTTDGYGNSFDSPEGFESVGSDLLDMLRTEGVSLVTERLPEWLAQASREGSGDDVTVGILYRSSSDAQPPESHDDRPTGQATFTV